MSDEVKHLIDQGDLREKLVSTAVKFLTNADVVRLTSVDKERFLRGKGLTDAEVAAAVARAAVQQSTLQSFSPDLVLVHSRRNTWFRDNVLPVVVCGGLAYTTYWFYKNFIRQLLFVERPRVKTTGEVLEEVRSSLESLSASVEALRREVGAAQAQAHVASLAGHIETVKTEIASVKGILLNRNQFPSLKTRASPPSIPAWQRQGEEATSTAPALDARAPSPPPAHRRAHRSQSGGSNSSGEHATKNSDSSLEIIT